MTASGEVDASPVRAFLPGPDLRADEIRVSVWPASVPALAQVLRDGLELGPWGIRPASWEDLSLVVVWQQFMRDPQGSSGTCSRRE
jgi:hypothetical protein